MNPSHMLAARLTGAPDRRGREDVMDTEPGLGIRLAAGQREPGRPAAGEPVFETRDVSVFYGAFRAVTGVTLRVPEHEITAFIGPSGCGKTTVLRTLNRMNDLVPGFRVEGTVNYRGVPLYGGGVSATAVRRRIGMVFQKPNPFPMPVYDNVAYGPRFYGVHELGTLYVIVEVAVRRAALWDEVRNRLHSSALGLSGGQAQRLCIARSLAVEPDVILMDEPCSSLDPIATGAIEDLMLELRQRYTIVVVTHNMQQAARVSDWTAFFSVLSPAEGHSPTGVLVEFGAAGQLFGDPADTRTRAYVTGKAG